MPCILAGCRKYTENTSPKLKYFIDEKSSVVDPDPGSGAFLTPGSAMGKNQDPIPGSGSGINIPNHISESLKTIFWVKILKFFYADPGGDPESF
jgi:hypothetical protein